MYVIDDDIQYIYTQYYYTIQCYNIQCENTTQVIYNIITTVDIYKYIKYSVQVVWESI